MSETRRQGERKQWREIEKAVERGRERGREGERKKERERDLGIKESTCVTGTERKDQT